MSSAVDHRNASENFSAKTLKILNSDKIVLQERPPPVIFVPMIFKELLAKKR